MLWPPDAKSWLIRKDPDARKDWGQEEKGTTEDEMVGCHHQFNGHEFGWTPGVGDGQGGLACCGSWGRKELDTTERLNWTKTIIASWQFISLYFFHLILTTIKQIATIIVHILLVKEQLFKVTYLRSWSLTGSMTGIWTQDCLVLMPTPNYCITPATAQRGPNVCHHTWPTGVKILLTYM